MWPYGCYIQHGELPDRAVKNYARRSEIERVERPKAR